MKRRIGFLVPLLMGVPTGIGLFTVHYAGGTSYLSDDPRVCTNCHIMNSQYESWQKASHHAAATCVDCHLPQEPAAKYLAKAINGYHHTKAFTLRDFHEPIMITERNAAILQDNCLRCHAELLHPLALEATERGPDVGCVHCHRAVGHGEWVGLGGPDRRGRGQKGGS